MDGLVAELVEGARAEMAVVAERGGAVAAVPYMKTQLVESHRERDAPHRDRRAGRGRPERVHRGRAVAAPGGRGRRDPAGGPGCRALVHRGSRGLAQQTATKARWTRLWMTCARRPPPPTRTSCRPRSPPPARERPRASGRRRFARCSASTAAPTGVGGRRGGALRRRARGAARPRRAGLRGARAAGQDPGRQARAWTATRTAPSRSPCGRATPGMDVVYEGIRLTPARIARAAVDEGVHVVGLSILSGSHAELIPDVLRELEEAGAVRAGGGRRDHPAGRRGRAARGRAWRASTRPRTSRSAASWATSSTSWRSTTA